MNGKKKEPKAKETKDKKKKTRETASDAEAEKPFDFGGLPDRDLKKNLGCG